MPLLCEAVCLPAYGDVWENVGQITCSFYAPVT